MVEDGRLENVGRRIVGSLRDAPEPVNVVESRGGMRALPLPERRGMTSKSSRS